MGSAGRGVLSLSPRIDPQGRQGGRAMGYFTVGVVGKDRPGIVAEVSRILFELGCNIEDSTCTILSGQFAMILVIGHPRISAVPEIDPAFEEVRAKGLSVNV